MSSAKFVRICVLVLILVAVFVGGVWHGWGMTNEHNAPQKRPQQNLQGIGKAIAMYAATHGLLSKTGGADSMRTPWFYAPNDPAIRWTKTPEGAPRLEIVREHLEPRRIIACSAKHWNFISSMDRVVATRGGPTRCLLLSTGDSRWVNTQEFQDELAKPENANFAKAFRASSLKDRF